MPALFTFFLRLPPEIRLLVWKLALCQTHALHERRVITINHNFTLGTPASRKHVQEDYPNLFWVCRDSRWTAEKYPDYTSVFDYDNPNWALPNSWSVLKLQRILTRLNLSFDVNTTDKREMQDQILMHMNDHREDRSKDSVFSNFGHQYTPIGPHHFNPDLDIILLKMKSYSKMPGPLDDLVNWQSAAQDDWAPELWSHNSLDASKMKVIAFEIDFVEKSSFYGLQDISEHPGYSHKLKEKGIINDPTSEFAGLSIRVPRNHLAALETIVFLCPPICEVPVISLDTGELLGADEWSFQLDTKSEAFKREMGNRWANVT